MNFFIFSYMFQEVEKIINLVELPSLLLGFLYVGKKLQLLDSMNKSIDALKRNVKVICDHLVSKNDGFDHTLLINYSPLKLKPEAVALLENIGFIDMFNQHSQDFLDLIDSEQPKNKFDVELQSTKAVLILFEKDYFNQVKNYLYNHPNVEYRKFAQVLGVYVRDQYLEKHPDI